MSDTSKKSKSDSQKRSDEPLHHAIFLFYNKAIGIQSKLAFSDDKKHCDVLVSHGRVWTAFQYTGKGLDHHVFLRQHTEGLLRHIKSIPELMHYVVVEVKKPRHHPWRPFVSNSCNEFCRKIAMVETGWTFNPKHLYTKLTNLDQQRNFTVLSKWSRRHGYV